MKPAKNRGASSQRRKAQGGAGVSESATEGKDYADAIVQTVREPLLVLDAEHRVKSAARSFYQTFKVTPEQTEGQLIYELGNGQWDIPSLRRLLDEILPTNGAFNNYEVEHDFTGIGPRTMLLNARRLHDGGKKTKLILLAIEDITERRRAEAELARRNAWFSTTLSSIGDAVIATDVEGRVTFLNSNAEKLIGWTNAEASGKPLHEVFKIVNEETREQVESPVSKAIRQGAVVGLANHTLLIAQDGTERPIDDSAAPIRFESSEESGPLLGVVMVFHDITERRRAEQRLENSEVRYRRLFEAAHDGILILETDECRITDVNPFIMKLLDYPRQYFIGKELWEIGVFQDKEASQKAMRELREKGWLRYENLPLEDRNGRRHAVEMVANAYIEDHTPVIQCNIRDISLRKKFERERDILLANEQAARMEAEAANRTKDVFLATLSHEVRTPLNAIFGWAGILRSKRCTDEELQEGMEVIERNCKIQAQLIEDMMDISRVMSGKLELDVRKCELSAVIAEAIQMVVPAANEKGLVIETDLERNAGPASCDPMRIRQVVWNLLVNAVKFTPRGGKIRITHSRERSRNCIQITDTGQGIAPDFLPILFDRFSQENSDTRRKFGGLGLGLSIVKALVEAHGGTVRAQSEGEGRGATFMVELPIRAIQVDVKGAETEDANRLDLSPETDVRLNGLRVLVVDDEADARRLVVKFLSEAGATAMAAATAAEALRTLESLHPNVLVSDLAMPNEDGFDLVRKVRSAGYSVQELPAVALSAYASKGFARRALLSGFQVHLPKPVDPVDLIAVVASLAGRIRGTRSPSADSESSPTPS